MVWAGDTQGVEVTGENYRFSFSLSTLHPPKSKELEVYNSEVLPDMRLGIRPLWVLWQ